MNKKFKKVVDLYQEIKNGDLFQSSNWKGIVLNKEYKNQSYIVEIVWFLNFIHSKRFDLYPQNIVNYSLLKP